MANENNGFVEIYYDENAIINPQIQIRGLPQPPKYEEVYKPPLAIHIPENYPSQFHQGIRPHVNVGPMPQPQPQMQLIGAEDGRLKHEKLHLIYGALSLVFGIITVILDPLLPAVFRYPYYLFPAGLFMIVSGICSIHGSRKRNECSLKASLTFNIFALILLFVGYVIGLTSSRYSDNLFDYNTNGEFIINYYAAGIQGLGVFNTIFVTIPFVIVLWDSTLKCGTLCCKRRLTPEAPNRPTSDIIHVNPYPNN